MISVKYATLSESYHKNMAEKIITREERDATQVLFDWSSQTDYIIYNSISNAVRRKGIDGCLSWIKFLRTPNPKLTKSIRQDDKAAKLKMKHCKRVLIRATEFREANYYHSFHIVRFIIEQFNLKVLGKKRPR